MCVQGWGMTFSWAHEGLEGDEMWELEQVSGSLLLHPHVGWQQSSLQWLFIKECAFDDIGHLGALNNDL